MGLTQTIDEVTAALDRPLEHDEFVMLCRMHDAESSVEDIIDMLAERPADIADEDVPVKRAEVLGREVRNIE